MLLRFVYARDFLDVAGNVERVKWTESVGWIMELSARRTRGMVVVGCRLFEIMVSLSQM